MKLLIENWRKYIAKETGGEQVEMLEKLLKMEFAQAMHIIDSLKTDEFDYRLEDDYEEALDEEYKSSQRELEHLPGLYYAHHGSDKEDEEDDDNQDNDDEDESDHNF